MKILCIEQLLIKDINVSIIDIMQDFQVFCVFLNIVITQKLGFIWLKNWVNMVCSYTTNTLVMIADIIKLITYKKKWKNRYFAMVFDYIRYKR